jgi:hypothetical protein
MTGNEVPSKGNDQTLAFLSFGARTLSGHPLDGILFLVHLFVPAGSRKEKNYIPAGYKKKN